MTQSTRRASSPAASSINSRAPFRQNGTALHTPSNAGASARAGSPRSTTCALPREPHRSRSENGSARCRARRTLQPATRSSRENTRDSPACPTCCRPEEDRADEGRARKPAARAGSVDRSSTTVLVRLWSECAAGGDSCWERFVDQVHAPLLRLSRQCARRFLGAHRRCDAADFVQEVYCRLLANDRLVLRRAHFDCDEQVAAMLRTMLQRIVLDQRRSEASRGHLRTVSLDVIGAGEVCERRTPEVEVLARETLECFTRDAVDVIARTRSPQRNRRIARATWFEGRSAEELGRREGLSKNAVYALLYRVRGDLASRHGWHVATHLAGP